MTAAKLGRTVIFVAHEYPPSAGGGVQRVAKLTRYLPASGYAPFVVTSQPAWGRATDESLASEVADVPVVRLPARSIAASVARILAPFKRPSAEPAEKPAETTVAPAAAAQPAAPTRAPGRRIPLSTRISRWLSVPDDARRWADDAVRAIVAEGRARDAVAVVASGPPHSTLMAGARAAQQLGVPFVADMRDAWVTNPSAYWPSGWHRRRSASLEANVMRSAQLVTAVSEPIAEEARERGAGRVVVIPNGYDANDLPPLTPRESSALRLGFMGRFYDLTDPEPLVRAIATARERGVDVTLDVIGPPSTRLGDLLARHGIEDAVTQHGYLPHGTALEVIATLDVGVVVIADLPGAEAVFTGKLFEYLGMGIFTLVVGPVDGAAAVLVSEVSGGAVVPYGDADSLADLLGRLAEQRREAPLVPALDREAMATYERSAQAARFAGLLDEITGVASATDGGGRSDA